MSDDLVKHLREGDHFEKVMSAEQAADRIEELEADLQDAHRVGAEWFEQSKQNHKRATTAEAKLEKAVEALEKLNVGEGWAAQIARTTLAELKEQK